MKIKIKQVDWSGWNGGSSSEKVFKYDAKLKKEIVVKDMKVCRERRFFFQSKCYSEIIFSFKVLKIGEDYVTIKTYGTAGGSYNKFIGKDIPIISTIKFGEVLNFSTKTMDAGSEFEVSIEK